MKRIILIICIGISLIACTEKIEKGLTLIQLEPFLTNDENQSMRELDDIFKRYNLIYSSRYSIRELTVYSLKEKDSYFDKNIYLKEVRPRLIKHGWRLVEQNEYGEFYCDKYDRNSLGVTFPALKPELEGINSGYYTYPEYKKLAVGLAYRSSGKSDECKFNSFSGYSQK